MRKQRRQDTLKFKCLRCNEKIEITYWRRLKRHAVKRTNYPYGKKSKGITAITHKSCGGLLKKINDRR